MRGRTRGALIAVGLVAGLLLVARIVAGLLFDGYDVVLESMAPTLEPGERVAVRDADVDDVAPGDVIVFDTPVAGEDFKIIHRVVAVGGQQVEARDGSVLVDGEPVEEGYLPESTTTADFEPVTVPDGQVFVLGDNRGDARDSRFFGPVDGDLIVGRVVFRYWPLSDLGGI